MTANLSEQKADEGAGRDPSGQALAAAPSSPSVSPLAGFDPSRGIFVELTPALLEDLHMAAGLARISRGWGHGPAAQCKKGERMAGYFYATATAIESGVLPAHAVGATHSLVLALESLAAQAIEARSAKTEGLGPKDESAVPSGMRPNAAPGVHP